VKKLFLCNCRGTFFDADFDRSKHTIRVKGWLKQKGFATVIFADVNLRGAEDKKIAEFAMKSGMTILTQDADFAKLYHAFYKRKLAVILVKTKEGTGQSIIQALNTAQSRIDLNKTQNNLVIISKRRLRVIS